MWVRSTEINEILEPKHIGAFCPSSKASKLWETVKLTLAIYPKNQVISYQMRISATPKLNLRKMHFSGHKHYDFGTSKAKEIYSTRDPKCLKKI